MLGTHYYHSCIKKTVTAFGTLFNNIQVIRKDPQTGVELEREKVALAYGPKDKFLARLEQSPDVDRKIAISMPRISFEVTDINYDSQRKTSPIQKYLKTDDGTSTKVQYMPVPYNIGFELGILSKNQDDALQILEQILPFFQPAFVVTVNMIPEMGEKKDLPVILNGITYSDEYEDDLLTRRSIVYTLQFTVKSYVYGPVTDAAIIRKATVFESIGDFQEHKRTLRYDVEAQALTDQNNDGVINAADNALLVADDDFGFNEGITLL